MTVIHCCGHVTELSPAKCVQYFIVLLYVSVSIFLMVVVFGIFMFPPEVEEEDPWQDWTPDSYAFSFHVILRFQLHSKLKF